MESTRERAGPSPDVLRDAAECVNSSVARKTFAWPLLLEMAPFLRGVFFKADTFELCSSSANLRIRSRTEVVRLSCSDITAFFSGAVRT